MRVIKGLMFIAMAVLLLTPPAGAYPLDLTFWNVTELGLPSPPNAGDKVTVDVAPGGAGDKTITFTWVDGDGKAPPVGSVRLFEIFFSAAVTDAITGGGAVVSAIPGATPGKYTETSPGKADGFGNFANEWRNSGAKTTTATFTFTNALPGTFTGTDFAANVGYGGGCAGHAGGAAPVGGGSLAACTPVPEPATMFLGGAGLMSLAFAARKRLFRGRAS